MVDVLPSGTAFAVAAIAPPAAPPRSTPAPPPPAPPPSGHGLFHELLSDLNPLQYIPVVGTIYRAITGDEGNPTLRFVGALGTSFALGGPIGVAITAGEKIAGIDPEKMVLDAARHLFHLGHADSQAPAAAPASSSGVSSAAFALDTHDMSADQLNALELQRLRRRESLGQMAVLGQDRSRIGGAA